MSTQSTKTTEATFTHNTVTINGKTFPAEYDEYISGDVYAIVTMQEGGKEVKVRIKIDQSNTNYSAAQEAAMQARALRAKPKAKLVAVVEPMPEPEPAAELVAVNEPVPAVEPVAELVAVAAAEPVAAVEPVAVSAKPFIGTEIAGEGWSIRFDAVCGRTRVILLSEPGAALREAIEKAGFYWSGVMKSWNKKLTVKAYKAAQALALDLRRLCA